jgi:hypothetical protein
MMIIVAGRCTSRLAASISIVLVPWYNVNIFIASHPSRAAVM